MTFYYYLTSLTDARWALYSSLEPRPTIFADKLAAMQEAKNRCRLHWEKTRVACGVRIQAAHGTWDEHYLAGDMADVSPETQESEPSAQDNCSGAAVSSNP